VEASASIGKKARDEKNGQAVSFWPALTAPRGNLKPVCFFEDARFFRFKENFNG
jgi:hypothetical protein